MDVKYLTRDKIGRIQQNKKRNRIKYCLKNVTHLNIFYFETYDNFFIFSKGLRLQYIDVWIRLKFFENYELR